jgi:hypothetical protein
MKIMPNSSDFSIFVEYGGKNPARHTDVPDPLPVFRDLNGAKRNGNPETNHGCGRSFGISASLKSRSIGAFGMGDSE